MFKKWRIKPKMRSRNLLHFKNKSLLKTPSIHMVIYMDFNQNSRLCMCPNVIS